MGVTTDKEELARRVKEYLEKNRSVDLRVFILDHWDYSKVNSEFVSEIANKLRASDKYEIKPFGSVPLGSFDIRKTSWRERNPVFSELRVGIITGVISLVVGWLLLQADNKEQARLDNRQDLSIQRLSDSLRLIEKQLKDSVKILESRYLPPNP